MPGVEKLGGELLFPDEKQFFSEGNKCYQRSFPSSGIMFSRYRIHFLIVSFPNQQYASMYRKVESINAPY